MLSIASKLWFKTALIFLILLPASVFFHEVGHWFVYKLNGVDCWMSLQRVNITNPENQISDLIFFRSLLGGPAVTLLISILSYVLLIRYPNSLWLFILGVINSTSRIIPTIIAFARINRVDLAGFSDEGNIVLRITENSLIRVLLLFSILWLYIFIFLKIYRTFVFPHGFNRKKLYVSIMFVASFFVVMIYALLDKHLFGL